MASLSHHMLAKCQMACYMPTDEDYYRKAADLKCEDKCLVDFMRVQRDGFQPRLLKETLDERERCFSECFVPRKGTTDQ